MITESKEQAKKIVDDASSEIQRRQDAAFEELKGQIAEIAVNAAEKIIRESLDAQKSKQVVDRYLNEVNKN
jgi:F-type H+-transporting ATPase subunit b